MAPAPPASPAPPQVLLAHHLRQLKLPTFLREYEKVATEAAREGLDHVRFIQHVRRGGRGSPWIVSLLKRKPPKLAAVALANKMARVAWKLMVTGERYAAKSVPAALANAT